MPQRSDPDTLKIPAYMRNKAIVKRDRQRLLWTAWDRKEAGVKPNSPRALGKVERASSAVPLVPGRTRLSNTQKMTRALEPVGSESSTVAPVTFTGRQRFVRAGEITDWLDRIGVAIIKTTRPLKSGDILLVEGEECIFTQPVDGMQIDRKPVKRAKKGSHIGLKVGEKAVAGGSVYLPDLRG